MSQKRAKKDVPSGEAPAGRQVALLRGINVGRAKRVAMADLRTIVEGLGYRDVRTLLNSGNVVFTATGAGKSNAASLIEDALAKKLGISSRVTVLTASELDAVVEDNPLLRVANDPSRLLVVVLTNRADRARLEPLRKQNWAPEALAIGKRVAYVWCPEGILASQAFEAVGRLLRDAATARNWATILKLRALTRSQQ